MTVNLGDVSDGNAGGFSMMGGYSDSGTAGGMDIRLGDAYQGSAGSYTMNAGSSDLGNPGNVYIQSGSVYGSDTQPGKVVLSSGSNFLTGDRGSIDLLGSTKIAEDSSRDLVTLNVGVPGVSVARIAQVSSFIIPIGSMECAGSCQVSIPLNNVKQGAALVLCNFAPQGPIAATVSCHEQGGTMYADFFGRNENFVVSGGNLLVTVIEHNEIPTSPSTCTQSAPHTDLSCEAIF
jgi:hypothetical protein